MPPRKSYPGPERRRFRRVDLRYPVRIELPAASTDSSSRTIDGVTENLSYGGALVGVSDASDLREATPVRIDFIEQGRAFPAQLTGVVWRRGDQPEGEQVALEFDAPLLAYEGAVELADRLQWLTEMGGEQFARANVDRFLDNVPDAIRSARDSMAAGDLDAVAQFVRGVKLNAGNIGAVNLYEMARRAEQAANAGDGAASERLVESLPTYLDAVRAELEPQE